MSKPDYTRLKPPTAGRFKRLAALLTLLALFTPSQFSLCAETALTKYQVEAIFLFNFAKYVDWPPEAFADAKAPFTIGLMGSDPFDDNLRHAIEGKTINGHPFVLKHLAPGEPLSGCQILFISDSESARMSEILQSAAALPILTVGEDDQFFQNSGIIEFVVKDGRVRLEINLAPAAKARLTISSRLLAVADVVKGRTN